MDLAITLAPVDFQTIFVEALQFPPAQVEATGGSADIDHSDVAETVTAG
mgnify:CR=1 FL=1